MLLFHQSEVFDFYTFRELKTVFQVFLELLFKQYPQKIQWLPLPLKDFSVGEIPPRYSPLFLHYFSGSVMFAPPPVIFYKLSVTNYMLLYSTLLCEIIAHAPGGRKRYKSTKLEGAKTK